MADSLTSRSHALSNGYRSNGARQILSPFRDSIPPERLWMRHPTLPGRCLVSKSLSKSSEHIP